MLFLPHKDHTRLTLEVTYSCEKANTKPRHETIKIDTQRDLEMAAEILQFQISNYRAIPSNMKISLSGHRHGHVYNGEILEGLNAFQQFVNEPNTASTKRRYQRK